eukprot:5340247-Amphidinium_carterae.1
MFFCARLSFLTANHLGKILAQPQKHLRCAHTSICYTCGGESAASQPLVAQSTLAKRGPGANSNKTARTQQRTHPRRM